MNPHRQCRPGNPIRYGQLLAEDGHGLRVLELPGHRHHDDPLHGHTLSPTQVGFLPLQERISAVAASLRWIYVSGEGGPPSPPGVPDGSGATRPMTVAKLDPAGADLSIAYDTGCSGANGHDIIHGTGVHLPVAPGGSYASAGGRCGIGTNSPCAWTATPSPLSGDFPWWLILAEDGSCTEGSWGKDSGGFERDGPGMNGASGQCGNTDKDLGNTCGQ